MPILRLPLGPWVPDAGENANPGLLVAKNVLPYAESWVPAGMRLARTATLPGISGSVPLTGFHVNPNANTTDEVDPDLILGHGTLYYGVGNPGSADGDIYAVDVDMFDSSDWTVTDVLAGTVTTGKEGWHFAAFGADEIAVCGHSQNALRRANGAGLCDVLFDVAIDTETAQPRPKFVAVGDERLIFANIANTGSPGPGGPDPDVHLVWWGATDAPGSIGDASSHPSGATDYQRLIDDHGPITGLVGGREFALVFKRSTIYRMDYGGPWGPTFKPIPQQFGTRHSHSIVRVGDVVYFWGPNGPARYIYDRVEDLGIGSFHRSLTDEFWVATDPDMRYLDFQDPEVGSLSEAYSVQVAYSAGTGNVIWRYYVADSSNQVRLICFNHWTNRAAILERDSVINNSDTTGDATTLGMVTMPDTGLDFNIMRDVLFFEEELGASTAKIYTMLPKGAEAHNHTMALGTGYFVHPEGKQNAFRIKRVRPVMTLSAGETAPTPTIKVISRMYPYDNSPVTRSATGIDRHGWVIFGQSPDRPEHRVQIEFSPTPFDDHPSNTIAEIEALDIEWEDGPGR